jgi:hypothetical protein
MEVWFSRVLLTQGSRLGLTQRPRELPVGEVGFASGQDSGVPSSRASPAAGTRNNLSPGPEDLHLVVPIRKTLLHPRSGHGAKYQRTLDLSPDEGCERAYMALMRLCDGICHSACWTPCSDGAVRRDDMSPLFSGGNSSSAGPVSCRNLQTNHPADM